jgi:FKBP-type peptidyl-prolyl cis-trans isomerase (trigger factor)
LKSNGTSEEDLREYATEKVKEELIIDNIMEQENLEPTDPERIKLENDYVSDYGYSDVNSFIKDCGRDYLNDEIDRKIVLDFIYKNAVSNLK